MRAIPKPNAKFRASESGQASVEYLVVAVSLLIAFAAISVAGQQACIDNMAGDLKTADCKNIGVAVGSALQKTVEEVTFLINLPF